jgi:hypothetical protein
MDANRKLSKHIGWMNYHAGLQQPISCNDVLQPLLRVGYTEAMQLLKDVTEKAAIIKNPTSYIMSAASRMAPTASWDLWTAGGFTSSSSFSAPRFHPQQASNPPSSIPLDHTGNIG